MPRIKKVSHPPKPDFMISIKDGEITTQSKARIVAADVIEVAHTALNIIEKVYGKNVTYQIATALIYEGGIDFTKERDNTHA